MGSDSGRSGLSTMILTREVRWFFSGSLPSSVRTWFYSSAKPSYERRLDRYDLASARNGVGRKRRGDATLDTKFRLDVAAGVNLAPDVTGNVEDWIKLSEPLGTSASRTFPHQLPVDKRLHTRHYTLASDPDCGCEVELAEIEVVGLRAWSLCFETFGAPERRFESLELAVDQFFDKAPPPKDIVLAHSSSNSYPDWLSQLQSRAS